MGYASYLEDITNKFGEFTKLIDEHNITSDKKIDISDYKYVRSQVMTLMIALKPYLDKDIDLNEALNLKRKNESLELNLKSITTQRDRLLKRFSEFEIESNKVENFLVEERVLRQTLNKLKADYEQLLIDFEGLKNNYTDLLFDCSALFQKMKEIITNPNWANNRDSIKEIENYIKMGVKKL
ncbi:hypothetical protein [Sediminibacterium sp. TEGAF015]|uniref:hypothetical protein n=1 Tax=Sediminibacterium sp. TEGAF015 TaxID=575378 RepID=UPI002208678A|nr:hypothetical protein [Sediminibacterium sp. TEGAF015]BDQ12127.1 hypothetical protein TEGAF0_13440 [Sediminibacterium sp. TEGAF015]